MLGVIPRPIHRWEIVIGKFIGFLAMVTLYSAGMFLALMAIIQNAGDTCLPLQFKALALFCFQPAILLAVTICGGTFLSTIANGVVALALYAVAVVGGVIEQIGYLVDIPALKTTGIITSLVMPVDAVYRKAVYVLLNSEGIPLTTVLNNLGPFGAAAEPSVWMMVYAALYGLGTVGMGVYLFGKRDI